jgi:hypothetical protein
MTGNIDDLIHYRINRAFETLKEAEIKPVGILRIKSQKNRFICESNRKISKL